MSLYYSNFRYLGENSIDHGLMVASFEPDSGFTDSFLTMEAIRDNYYDGTKVFDYGARYSSLAVINITVVKDDASDFSMSEVRSISKWLTGARTNSWLDVSSNRLNADEYGVYAFLGRITNLQPYKMDGRIIGFKIEFSSITPWAFSAPQEFDCIIGQLVGVLESNDDLVLIKVNVNGSELQQEFQFGLDADGVLHPNDETRPEFMFDEKTGVAYIDNAYRDKIDNQSDDLYTYIYLDIDYQNKNGTHISIINDTLQEITQINNVSAGEHIEISSKQFIISSIPNKLFGDDFNFVWPRLKPGVNDFIIDGNGNGSAKFTYRYPMKIGDCAIDLDVHSGGVSCANEEVSIS